MNFKELEKLVNEKIEELNLSEGKFGYEECAWEVRKIIREIIGLEENEEISLECGYGSNGNIRLRSRKNYNYEIDIKVRRKKNGFEYAGIWGLRNFYGIKKIEIDDFLEVESIDGFVKFVEEKLKEKEEYNQKKVSDFEGMLESSGIGFKEFYEMMEKYKSIDYSDKKNLAKKFTGDSYYKYI